MNRFSQILNRLLFVFVISFFFVISAVIGRVNILNTVLIILFQIIMIIIGSGVQRLVKINHNEWYVWILSSYGLGVAISIYIYILLLSLQLQNFSFLILAILALFSLYFDIIKNLKCYKELAVNWGDSVFVSIILVIICLLRIITFQGNNLSPLNTGYTVFERDLFFWFRNCVAATKAFPLPYLTTADHNFHYHYFSSIYVALIHYLSGISVFDCTFSFSYIWENLLLVSGAYVFFRGLLKSRLYSWLGILFTLFTSGVEVRSILTYVWHMYIGPFGYSFGCAFGMLTIYFFIKWFYDGDKHLGCGIISVLLIGITVGAKIPIAIVIMAGLGMGCFILLFKKETRIKGVLTGVAYLLMFLIIYFIFIKSDSTSSFIETSEGFSFNTILNKGYLGIRDAVSKHTGVVLANLFVFCLYIVEVNPSLFLLAILALFVFLLERKRWPNPLIMGAISLFGFTLGSFIELYTQSNMYFVMAIFPYFTFGCIYVLDSAEYSNRLLFKIKTVIPIVVTIILAIGVVFFEKYDYLNLKRETAISGFIMINNVIDGKLQNGNISDTDQVAVSRDEVLAFEWIRENTDRNSIIITNRFLLGGTNENYSPAACFSERTVYYNTPVEIYTDCVNQKDDEHKRTIVSDFYMGEANKVKGELRESKVKYAILYKDINEADEKYGEEVYRNDSIIVYNLE